MVSQQSPLVFKHEHQIVMRLISDLAKSSLVWSLCFQDLRVHIKMTLTRLVSSVKNIRCNLLAGTTAVPGRLAPVYVNVSGSVCIYASQSLSKLSDPVKTQWQARMPKATLHAIQAPVPLFLQDLSHNEFIPNVIVQPSALAYVQPWRGGTSTGPGEAAHLRLDNRHLCVCHFWHSKACLWGKRWDDIARLCSCSSPHCWGC